ncbi:B-cell lymphoma 3 protein [Gastrophryne carolinensis]
MTILQRLTTTWRLLPLHGVTVPGDWPVDIYRSGGMETASPLDLSLRKGILGEIVRSPTGFWGRGSGQVAKPLQDVKVENAKPPAEGGIKSSEESGLFKNQACLPLRKRRFPPCTKEEEPPIKTTDDCKWMRQYCGPYARMPVAPMPAFYQESPAAYVPPTVYPTPTIITPQPLKLLPTYPPTQLPSDVDLHADIMAATQQDEDGDTALHIAVAHGNILAVRQVVELMKHGRIDLDIMNYIRQTPLHLAVIIDQPELVTLLLEHGSSPNIQDRNGQTCFHLACEYGSIGCLEVLMRVTTRDLEATNYQGMTALHIAVSTGRKDLTLCLLEHGADVNAVDIKSGQSPLIQAVENGHEEMVSLLIQHGARVNQLTYAGNTALHVASGRGLAEITRLLMRSGADSTIKNCHNDTAMTVSKNKKTADILRGKSSSPCAQRESLKEDNREYPSPTQYGVASPRHSSRSPL